MSYFESISEHNKDLAAQRSAAGTLMPSLPQALPNVKVIIIGCADMRVDPAHVLLTRPCHDHFSLKAVARVTSLVSRCISIAPAMLDRYLAA